MNRAITQILYEVAEIIMGQSPESESYNDKGDGIPFYQGKSDFGEVYPTVRMYCTSPKKIAMANDILMSVRAPIGDVNIAREKCCIGRGLAAIRPRGENNLKYLFYLLDYYKERLAEQGTGSTFKAVGKDILKEFKIPVWNLEKQQMIADIVDEIQQLIFIRREALSVLDELVKSRFVEMFGNPHHSEKYPYKKVQEFTEVRSGGTPSRKQDAYWTNGTIRWVKTAELQNNEIYDTEEKITQEAVDNSSAKMLPENTILIAMYGQGKTRGMTAYLKVESTTNQACACVLPSDEINQRYLWRYFMMSYEQLRAMALGAGQPNLTGEMIKNFPVLMPPLELQEKYVLFAEQTDKSKLSIQQSIETLQTLKAKLMQEYF